MLARSRARTEASLSTISPRVSSKPRAGALARPLPGPLCVVAYTIVPRSLAMPSRAPTERGSFTVGAADVVTTVMNGLGR